MAIIETAVIVVGMVSLVRKVRPEIDGWVAVGTAFGASLGVLCARAAAAGAPEGNPLQMVTTAASIGAGAVGLVHLADRMARPASLGRPAPPLSRPTRTASSAEESSDSEPPPTLMHRETLPVRSLWRGLVLVGAALLFGCMAASLASGPAPTSIPDPYGARGGADTTNGIVCSELGEPGAEPPSSNR